MRRFLTLIGGADQPPQDGALEEYDYSSDRGEREQPPVADGDALGGSEGGATPIDDLADDLKVLPEGGTGESDAVPKLDTQTSPLHRLHDLVLVLRRYVGDDDDVADADIVIDALKDLAEVMVWADQHDPNIWDAFLEFAVMPLLVRCLRTTQELAVVEVKEEGDQALEVLVRDDAGNIEKEVGHALESVANGSRGTSDGKHDAHDGKHNDHDGLLVVGEDVEFDREFTDQLKSSGTSIPGNASNELAGLSDGAEGGRDEVEDSETAVRVNGVSSGHVAVNGPDSMPPANSHGKAGDDIAEEANQSVEQGPIRTSLDIQAQLLQTISIIIQSVTRHQSLLCLFSSNHINEILSFPFSFEQDEMLAYFMSAVKSIALKLDEGLLQLFFDPARGSFPLYTAVTHFFDHPESMVRIAVRNVTLTIYALGDAEVLKFAAKDDTLYFQKAVELLARLCGSVARAFELLLDDGREIRRTRSRTGIFRRRVKTAELTAKLDEIENMCAYLGEVSTVSKSYMYPLVMNLLSSRLFSPFFRPLASQASPEAIQLLHKRWRLTRSAFESDTRPALPLLDAAARCLVLACVLTHCKASPLGSVLVRDLCRPTLEFEHRHVLHGLKAMATDISGTERVTFIALCAIEAFINCDSASRQVLSTLKYDFYLKDEDAFLVDGENDTSTSLINIGMPDEDDLERRSVEPLMMTLSDFDAPLTPNSSRPSTPTLPTMASMASMGSLDGLNTPPNGSMENRLPSFDSTFGLTISPPASTPPPVERSDSDGILSSFQLGEASLREAISSVVLVVRRREVRTLRVMYRVVGIINAVQERTSDFSSSVDVTKIILDELAGVVYTYMKNKRTTIVSIEQMFDNFRSAADSSDQLRKGFRTLSFLLSPDALPSIASDFPKGTGKRRRVLTEDAAPPTEVEDAQAFFIMAHAYDDALRAAKALERFGCLSKQLVEALTDSDVEDSYLEKRDALESVSEIVLKHGEVR